MAQAYQHRVDVVTGPPSTSATEAEVGLLYPKTLEYPGNTLLHGLGAILMNSGEVSRSDIFKSATGSVGIFHATEKNLVTQLNDLFPGVSALVIRMASEITEKPNTESGYVIDFYAGLAVVSAATLDSKPEDLFASTSRRYERPGEVVTMPYDIVPLGKSLEVDIHQPHKMHDAISGYLEYWQSVQANG